MSETAATVALKGEAERETKFIRIGRTELVGVIDHDGRVDQSQEQIKNFLSCIAPERRSSWRHARSVISCH
jgi:hypothetical protein